MYAVRATKMRHRKRWLTKTMTTTIRMLLLPLAIVLSAMWTATPVMADDYGLPTEVVEEWGCHDTELRLTCGRLDATIAILESTYTPNCTGQPDDDACIHMDFKKLTRSYTASPRTDAHLTETEAGRQFLVALQRHRIEAERAEQEAAMQDLDALSNDRYGFVNPKSKRNSLRDTLESLIVDYLHELSPETSDVGADAGASFGGGVTPRRRRRRRRRSARHSSDYYEDVESMRRENGAGEGADAKDGDVVVDVNVLRKIEIGSRNITVRPTPRSRRTERIGQPSECAAFRRRVTKLDQYELDKALMKNDETRELNIRRVLNHRCSGKNHCSFVFSADYPFSILWHDGIVRIKYICMNNFRLNKFCDERLRIDNEPEPTLLPSAQPKRRGEPIAEARIQTDQSFHHLKILKSSDANNDVDDLDADTDNNVHDKSADGTEQQNANAKRRRLHKQQQQQQQQQSRVYSQDFRFFKIIPSHVNRTDTPVATNEIYMKVDPQLATIPTMIEHKTEKTTVQSSSSSSIRSSSETTTIINSIDHVIPESTTLTMTTMTMPATTPNTKVNHKHNSSVTTISQLDVIPDDVEEIFSNEIGADSESDYDDDDDDQQQQQYLEAPITTTASTAAPTTTAKPSKSAVTEETVYEQHNDNDDDDDDDKSYEDYAVETFGRTVVRKNKVRIHTSYQLPAYTGSPLQQGFLASTGYPMYYIGESNCSWTLSAPHGHRVRLTVLDLNLRVDESCRDVLEIIDQNNVIFSSCQELPKPMQIVSDSHEIRVSLRTTSRLAYPKRGVLLHYTAMGCLLLPEPANGRLVQTARDTARYACEASFVFADTAASSRELHCTEHYTWDKSLPDCIEQHLLQPNAITDNDHTDVRHNHTLLTHQRHRLSSSLKTPSAAPTSTTIMAGKSTDLMYDVAIPSMIIAGLFLLNTVVFVVIMRYRNKRKLENECEHEMSRL